MDIPSDDEIRALHEKYAPTPEAFDSVYTHCVIVCEIAEQLIERRRLVVDAGLVRAGCLLHDIGVYRLCDAAGRIDYSQYVRHGVLGHELLREAGLPEQIRRFCSHHTGVGLTRDDVREQGLPIPVDDYLAESDEEELVMYADKFHTKSDPPVFVSADTFAVKVRRYGDGKAGTFRALVEPYGEPDFAALQAVHGHGVV